MECPVCATRNSDSASECEKCHTPLPTPVAEETLTPVAGETLNEGGVPEDWTVASSSKISPVVAAGSDTLDIGTVLAGRYELLQLIGRGGMGAVYKARDRELDRVVALKLIRPELAKNPDVLRRFKQELILARQVTHKNVIRIFDLGQSDGIKFITMDFVEGQDLRQLLAEKGKLAPEQAARIMLQICRALEAAHAEGVIHRDLKPQNIMVDASGRVYVMDFGIARSAYLPGMTQTGALIGTPEYMSPEQGRGEKLTERSDIFSLGIIFYELLTGKSPYFSDTPLATLWKRMTEKVTPPAVVDPTLPQELNTIVVKALEIEPKNRFASAREMVQQLEIWLGPSVEGETIFLPAPRTTSYWKWASAALAVLLVAGVITFRLISPRKPKPAHPPVSVLVADFTNHTGDPIFDDTLEPMFNVALEGASFINAFSRGNARMLAEQLPHPTDKLDEQTARLIAVSQGLGAVVTGSLSRRGDGYKVSVEALDARSGSSIAAAEVSATNKDALLLAVPKLVAPIRKALGDTTPESVQLAAAETFTSASLEAAHEYALAQTADLAGKWGTAIEHALKALQLDPELGRAYVVLGVSYHNTGQPQEAEKYFRLALAKIDSMSDREKYRTRGAYYLMMRNPDKALEQFTQLVKQYPSDSAGLANLALAYFYRRDMVHALEEGRRAVEIYPNNVAQRNNVGLYAMYAGDFASGIQEQQKVLEQNPSLVLGYVGTALSQLGEGHPAEAVNTYQLLQKLGPQPASTAAAGLADVALYEGRVSDAVEILRQGAKDDLANKNPDGAANKFAILAQAYLLIGNDAATLHAADQGLQQSKETGIMFWAARAYLGAKKPQRALALAQQLANRLEADPQAYAKLIEAEYALGRGKAREALQLSTDSRKIADTWMGRYDAALAYLNAGAYAEADTELEVCLKRRGEATALFLDESPTYHLFPPVYYYLGRAQEGLKSPAASDSYKNFLAFKDKANHDPLVADARRRLASP